MPQQAVTNGKGKKEYLRPQLIILFSFDVTMPLPNMLSNPIVGSLSGINWRQLAQSMQADFDGLRGTTFVIYTGINSSLWSYAYIVENPPLLIKRQVPSSTLTSRSHCGNGVS